MRVLVAEDEPTSHRVLEAAFTWQALEKYIERHSEATFSHGLCPECLEKHYRKDL